MTRTRRAPPIERALAACAPPVVIARMSPDETSALQQRWRESFATRIKAATGTWVHKGFDWHAFSYEFVYRRQGAKAIAEYQRCRAFRLRVLPHLDDEAGYWCESEQLPALHGRDAYVSDPEFTWTMGAGRPNKGLHLTRPALLRSAAVLLGTGEAGLATEPLVR